MLSGPRTTQKRRELRFRGRPGDPLTMSHVGPPDSIRRWPLSDSAASSAKVVSTLGAARTRCSSSRRRSAMRGTQLWLQAQTVCLRPLALTVGHHRCTFNPSRCPARPGRQVRAPPLPERRRKSALGALRTDRRRHCTFGPWRCADKLQSRRVPFWAEGEAVFARNASAKLPEMPSGPQTTQKR